ncbi:MAG: hypothetical protein EBY07_11120, partial [Actinobacteria bacterium]|nr:hypothetical protein [Actinomycetota bacterium]
MDEVILGLDIGTSSLKGIFLSGSGEILAKYEVPLALARHGNNGEYVEQDANDYSSALIELIAADLQSSALIHRVQAIGLSGHTPSLVPIDIHGLPTAPVMIWQD